MPALLTIPEPAEGPDFQTPVLFLIFNRPDATAQVLAQLRAAGVRRLYVAADGPRPGHPTDAALCAEARALVLQAGRESGCEVHTLFREANLGCSTAVAEGISWFFEHEPEGIIVEDDCLPTPGFFLFCAELLARYRHDTRVVHISGNSFGTDAGARQQPHQPAYYFSQQIHSWGWATWRRAWQLYDLHLRDLPRLARSGRLRGSFSSRLEEWYFLRKCWGLYNGPRPFTTWDYQWHFARAAHSGLAIMPAVNLVTNIGFGHEGATHTQDAADPHAALPTGTLCWPLRHPGHVLSDRLRDRQQFRAFLAGRLHAKLRALLGREQSVPVRQVPLSPPLVISPTIQLTSS
ncbi:nucleotide-diphospho-sugar transferase [Hymenobacter lapidiphilus]|uniref:Nucleotide-diphospho-sugar transferase n=1 Tax=Hymenobacter lapidiphilus TaxID=2608003 RepID=A0A7Y7PRM5_9BACT|nr:nucleotide-diphospho-sugar transferase [Hymenobacter lapidiphilus]NVO32572.1 nucleotide-diphospho-sugar transferase [Hymenobacter lapidiphilus]